MWWESSSMPESSTFIWSATSERLSIRIRLNTKLSFRTLQNGKKIRWILTWINTLRQLSSWWRTTLLTWPPNTLMLWWSTFQDTLSTNAASMSVQQKRRRKMIRLGTCIMHSMLLPKHSRCCSCLIVVLTTLNFSQVTLIARSCLNFVWGIILTTWRLTGWSLDDRLFATSKDYMWMRLKCVPVSKTAWINK
jgi:hypothetical protein